MQEFVQLFGGYISDYGYGALFALFFLGIMAFPVPEETLLVFSGFLVSTGQLSYLPTLFVCFFGSISAMTAAYWIGRKLGKPVLMRVGKRFGFTEQAFLTTEKWFQRTGKWALPLGYFIPVVRQYTAYFAGITQLSFPVFMLYAYIGGFFWSVLFVTLGWQLGDKWEQMFEVISHNLAIFFVVLLLVVVFGSYWYQRKKSKKQGVYDE